MKTVKYQDVIKIKTQRRSRKIWGDLDSFEKLPKIVYYTKGDSEDVYSGELVEEVKGEGYIVTRI
jgi:hypothetical protein|tara:strand:+ start:8094 stop:8288 length:195 start_codon:yes stop_codon:yes gene_type:complete